MLIGIPTVYKVVNNYNNNLYRVIDSKIINSAKKCYYEEVCKENKITLAKLYKLKYLEKVSNPVTKEHYNEESYVKVNKNKFEFIVKE